MTKRERLMSWAFWLLVGGLLLGTSAGRASLAAPVNVGVVAVRVAIGFAVMHAFVPAPLRNPLPWSLIQEIGLFFLVLLCDLALLPPRFGGPDRPRRTPAAALRTLMYSITTAARERRRISRAS